MLVDIWHKITPNLREHFGNLMFETWLSNVLLSKIENSTLFLTVPTNLVKYYVEDKFSQQIIKFAQNYAQEIEHLQIMVDPKLSKPVDILIGDRWNDNRSIVNPSFTFENFIVDQSNKICYESAKNLAENKNINFNPFYICGDVGLGKTHLMHSIYWHSKKLYPNKKVIYMSAETFMYKFITSIKNKDSENFKQTLRSVDILMIDDIQFIADKESTQIELAHTINTLLNTNKQIILSANCSYAELNGFSQYLCSRFAGGLTVNIFPPTYDLRFEILQAKASYNNLNLPIKVLKLLAEKVTSNVRELEGALQRIVSYVSYINTNVDEHTVCILLKDMLKGTGTVLVSINDIINRVCQYYKVNINDIYSKSRLRSVVRCRQIIMYLCRKLTQLSIASIAYQFKGRDVTTITYGIKVIEKLLKTSKQLNKDIKTLEQDLLQ